MTAAPSITISPFRQSDQRAVQDLINAGLGEHWGSVNPEMNPDLFDIAQTYQKQVFLVVRSGIEIIGTGALVGRSKITAEIVRMSVAPHFRRRGIGHRIIDQLILIGRERGFQEVILETTTSWQAIINFYMAYGFKITHHLDGDTYFSLNLKKDPHKS
jgi:ribosomal protein S18 acetylase RimI-like enzyme